MPILDFKEIAEAHIPNGKQDTFEMFCQQVLQHLGFSIESVPDRGPDGGKDLLCIEHQNGILDRTEIRWLVSCKHKSTSGTSVGVKDEENIIDRIAQHKADGFIGFYSTVVSSSLNDRFNVLKEKTKIKILNCEEIETVLLSNAEGEQIAARFFPVSYNKWKLENKKPSNILTKYEPLVCDCCGKDLFQDIHKHQYGSIICFVEKESNLEKDDYTQHIVDVFLACKGNCDMKLGQVYRKAQCITTWEDIGDLIIPTRYLSWYMAIINSVYYGKTTYDQKAFEKIKNILITLSQLVLRHQSQDDIQRLESLAELPEYI